MSTQDEPRPGFEASAVAGGSSAAVGLPAESKPVSDKQPEDSNGNGNGTSRTASPAEREAMWQWYYANGCNKFHTAAHFRRGRNTIVRIAKQDKWDERAATMRERIHNEIDNSLALDAASRLKIVKGCLAKELQAYFDKNRRATGSLQNVLDLLGYIDAQEGPTVGKGLSEIASAIKGQSGQSNMVAAIFGALKEADAGHINGNVAAVTNQLRRFRPSGN